MIFCLFRSLKLRASVVLTQQHLSSPAGHEEMAGRSTTLIQAGMRAALSVVAGFVVSQLATENILRAAFWLRWRVDVKGAFGEKYLVLVEAGSGEMCNFAV